MTVVDPQPVADLSDTLARLHGLCAEEMLSGLDVQLASMVARRQPEDRALVLAVALASHALSQGQVCASLHRLPAWLDEALLGQTKKQWVAELQRRFAEPAREDQDLLAGQTQPVVVSAQGYLYLQRSYLQELRIARSLRSLATASVLRPESSMTELRTALEAVFEMPPDQRQLQAVATALLRRLCVVTGGPGTGKTSVVAALMQAAHQQLRIPYAAMVACAPTGKAVARLKQALQPLPIEVMTLHRLLGIRRGRDHTAADPSLLAQRLVVCDEVSMVSQALWGTLLTSIGNQTHLVLLGDKDQLASVEAGAVLAHLCEQGHPISACWQQILSDLKLDEGTRPSATEAKQGNLWSQPPAEQGEAKLADCVVQLQRNYRFAADEPMGLAAAAVRDGASDELITLLRQDHPQLQWRERPGTQHELQTDLAELANSLTALWQEHLGAGWNAANDLGAWQNRFRVLCAHRRGPGGVQWVNEWFEQRLPQWYPGRPVLVTRNQPGLQLFNGDLGTCMATPLGPVVAFPALSESEEGGHFEVPASQLADHQSAYAMTVHKSQGSEFDVVAVILPQRISPILTRELLYTAMTRARKRVVLWGSEATLRHAVSTPSRHESGLGRRLWGS